MGTFSPWYSGTPSYSTYSDLGSLSGRPSIKEVQRNAEAPVAMPHNTTTVMQAPAVRPQQRQQSNPLSNINSLAKMAKSFMKPSDVTGTGPSTPGYSMMGMDMSGENAIIAADKAEALGAGMQDAVASGVITDGEISTAMAGNGLAEEALNYVPGAFAEEGAGMTAGGILGTAGAGLVGGKIGNYFGNWAGAELGIGGKEERSKVGATLGGAAAGATAGAMFGGVGAIPGAVIGGIGGLMSSFF